ncbi:MAG: flagellar biosynthetic protein FliR [Chlamydiae bacterium]|nr:flagellar biosynthetic protein FliR [Chlamydiota bacterium]
MGPGQEYSSFFSHLYLLSPLSFLSFFLLGLCRLAPLITIAPFLGAKLPPSVKMGMLISFTILFLPMIAITSHSLPTFGVLFIGYAIKEIFLGFIIAFLITIPFQFAQSAGVLVDFMRGASSLQVNDPFSSAQASPIGNLYSYTLIAMFYTIGGPFFLFSSLLSWYKIFPVDAFINPVFFAPNYPFWPAIIGLVTKVLALSIQLSAPSLLAILMTEVFLGIANRLAPQVQIAFLGMSLKSLIGLALLCISWFFILQQLEKQTISWMQEMDRILFLVPSTLKSP